MAMATQATYGAPAAKKMKLEHDGSAPGTPQPSSSTPAPTYTTSQWSTPIPIDPALQQQPATTTSTTATQSQTPAVTMQQIQRQAPIMNYQHYQAYGATHYPQYTAQHYSQYQPAQTAPVPTAASTAATTTAAAAPLSRQPTQTATTAPETDQNADISTLNDAVGSAGLDLRAEEETLQRSQDYYSSYRSYEDRSRKQPNSPSFDTRILGTTMRTVGTRHKVSRVPEDTVNYLALALRARLQTLIEAMAGAAQHRATSQFDRTPSLYEDGSPMWSIVVRRDLKKQLEVLERVEREEEIRLRKERRERADAAAAVSGQAAGSPSLDGTGAANGDETTADGAVPTGEKAKKKKDGPGVTAKNLSEDVQKRLSNATAAQAAGLGRGKYAWMNAGAVSSAPSPAPTKPKPSTSTPSTQATTASTQPTTQSTATGQTASTASSWSKPYVPASAKASQSPAPGDEDKVVVTMRDAMFIVERERGHGGGRGAAHGWV